MSKYGHRTHNWFESIVNKLGGEEGAEAFLRDELKLVKAEEDPLLSVVWTIQTMLTEPTVTCTSPQFKGWFHGVPDGELSEELTIRKLARRSRNTPIITALGGEEASAVTWADFKSALAEKEAEGDHTSIMAYMVDVNGVLRSVRAFWGGVGWDVRACSLDSPEVWFAGRRVLSRPPAEALA